MMMTFLPLFLSPNYPLMCDKTRKNGPSLRAGAFHNDKIILSQPPVLWMGIIMFCPKHLRFSCPDLQSKWVQLMTITLQVSQHRHELIESYLGGERACPPSKYVMITAVTQWGWRETQMLPGQSICVCISTALTSPDKPEWMDSGFPCGPRRVELNGRVDWTPDQEMMRANVYIKLIYLFIYFASTKLKFTLFLPRFFGPYKNCNNIMHLTPRLLFWSWNAENLWK